MSISDENERIRNDRLASRAATHNPVSVRSEVDKWSYDWGTQPPWPDDMTVEYKADHGLTNLVAEDGTLL